MLFDTVKSSVLLAMYNHTYEKQLSNFHLPKEQLQFTCMPLDKINNPAISNSANHVLILENSVPVGYFALENGEKLLRYRNNSNALLLTAFSINSKNQGKGLAKMALELLPDFIRNNLPHIDEIVLGVNMKNKPALNLYLNTGFVDKNEFYEGPKGPQHILHLRV